MTHAETWRPGSSWVDRTFLAGPAGDPALLLDRGIDRAELRGAVAARQAELAADGVAPGSTVALRLPPSLAYITSLLAAWRAGAQVTILDHRLTAAEVEGAVARLSIQLLVEPETPLATGSRCFYDVRPVTRRCGGKEAQTRHALCQLSSGSTGPSKVIGRTAESLVAEVDRYTRIEGIPATGERVVVAASLLHVLGLVAGLLHSLHRRVELVIPERVTAQSMLKALAGRAVPTTFIGVPFHAELLAAVEQPPALPHFVQAITAGERLRQDVWEAFERRYGIAPGSMYGMTEAGVIATDIFGNLRPALALAPGMRMRASEDELLLALPESPYVALVDPTRFADGWLRTRDSGTLDPVTGHLTVLGRLDAQVSIGGLKVDLAEVEQTLTSLTGVSQAVVVFDRVIEAYVVLESSDALPRIEAEIVRLLAPYKRPRALRVLPEMPRTATGKLVRSVPVLQAAARDATRSAPPVASDA
jgi:acyl-coenzyme A synthetase/AMP-(fatty) acid ligase